MSPLLPRHKSSVQVTAVLLIAITIRLACFVSNVHPSLQRRPELSTPLTSWRNLQEGVFLYRLGGDPYAGGVFYHSPLYLLAFAHILPTFHTLLSGLVFIVADLLNALLLVAIWRSRKAIDAEERTPLILASYLLHPYTITTCAARSTAVLDNTVVLASIALTFHALSACSTLAAASHLSAYPILLLPAISLASVRLADSRGSHVKNVVAFTVAFATLTAANHNLVGPSWVRSTWGTILSVTDLTPNVGMWWYFFTEMFDHFRSFFLGVFQLHIVIYVAPVCMRLREDPLLAIAVLLGISGTWKTFPSLSDLVLWSSLLACCPETVQNLRHPLFTVTVYIYSSILLPLLHTLWLLTGSGNANFFYAATMVFGLNSSLAVVDVLATALRLRTRQHITEYLGLTTWPKDDWTVVQLTGVI